MRRHRFTPEQTQRGGWARARQKADYRRAHPTDLEAQVRAAIDRLGLIHQDEFEIWNEYGPYPQWIDVYLPVQPLILQPVAIEIDGSHAWHDRRYPSSKMYDYDQAKRLWCEANGVRLVVVHDWFYGDAELLAIVQSELLQPVNYQDVCDE